jgi:serine/threonine-protein phosphatase 2B catalytic subunit
LTNAAAKLALHVADDQKAKSIIFTLLSINTIYIEADLLRNKIRAMSRMMKMFKTLREENESIVQLKGICPDGKVPKGLLLEGKRALESEIKDRKAFFSKARELDMVNEAMPHNQQDHQDGGHLQLGSHQSITSTTSTSS